MKFDSFMPTKLISGRGAVSKNSAIFGKYGTRCLIVTGGSGAKLCGALEDCETALKNADISFAVFDGIEPNPQTATCFAAGSRAREMKADFIIGIGGGSPMDAAKAVAIYAANPEMEEADIYTRSIPAKALPVLLIGTTAGTGSEVTGVSVLTLTATGKKKSISGPDCYAAVSFCDYGYTTSLPEKVTVSTALDAFAHAAESILTNTANDLSVSYAKRAIELLRPFILRLCDLPELSETARDALYTASIYAGLAINITGTCFPHTVGYYLTENYKIPHGMACIAFMPLLLRRAKKYCPEKLGAIEIALGMTADDLCKILSAGVTFDVEISETEARRAVFAAKIKNFDRSPGGFTAEDAKSVLAAFRSDFVG